MNLQTHLSDIPFMLRAIDLALQGRATVSPNPMVGALLVKGEKIIGEGYHQKKGGPHAEVVAIEAATESVNGATLYCTLEPCCHTNKLTPPCVDLILKSQIKKVVIGSLDPNPEVSGKGVLKLRENGVEVVTGVLQKKCDEINNIFFKNMKELRPFVHIKAACTLDGRMASSTGSSKWITSPQARSEVHQLRLAYDAVMVGKNTVIKDNPSLTARLGEDVIKTPKKIIVGDLNEEVADKDLLKETHNLINIYSKTPPPKEVLGLKKKDTWVETFKELYQMGICSILVEGGPTLLSSLIDENCYDRMSVYVAPKFIGNGPSIIQSNKNLNMEKISNLNGFWRLLSQGEAVFEVGA